VTAQDGRTAPPGAGDRGEFVPTTDLFWSPEVLDAAECRRLLAAGTVGRLGFTDGALPAIVPVPYTMRDGNVLIAARRDDPVLRAVRGAVVAFEVGTYDAATMSGWSVVVVGPSRVSDTADPALPGDPEIVWPLGSSRAWFITVRSGLVRGWRVTAVPVPAAAD
jgi:hypothetical protein